MGFEKTKDSDMPNAGHGFEDSEVDLESDALSQLKTVKAKRRTNKSTVEVKTGMKRDRMGRHGYNDGDDPGDDAAMLAPDRPIRIAGGGRGQQAQRTKPFMSENSEFGDLFSGNGGRPEEPTANRERFSRLDGLAYNEKQDGDGAQFDHIFADDSAAPMVHHGENMVMELMRERDREEKAARQREQQQTKDEIKPRFSRRDRKIDTPERAEILERQIGNIGGAETMGNEDERMPAQQESLPEDGDMYEPLPGEQPGIFGQPYGYPTMPYGYPQQPYGYPPMPYGYPQQPYGYPPAPYGYPQKPYGYPPMPYGYPQQPYGYPMPEQPYGYPPMPEQYGYPMPEQPYGYPPMLYGNPVPPPEPKPTSRTLQRPDGRPMKIEMAEQSEPKTAKPVEYTPQELPKDEPIKIPKSEPTVPPAIQEKPQPTRQETETPAADEPQTETASRFNRRKRSSEAAEEQPQATTAVPERTPEPISEPAPVGFKRRDSGERRSRPIPPEMAEEPDEPRFVGRSRNAPMDPSELSMPSGMSFDDEDEISAARSTKFNRRRFNGAPD